MVFVHWLTAIRLNVSILSSLHFKEGTFLSKDLVNVAIRKAFWRASDYPG